MRIDEERDGPGALPEGSGEAPESVATEGAFEHLAAELTTTFVDAAAEAIDDHIEAALERVAIALDLDRSAVGQRVDEHLQTERARGVLASQSDTRPDGATSSERPRRRSARPCRVGKPVCHVG